jgi:hypothetical protein
MVKNINLQLFRNPVIEGTRLIDTDIQMEPIDIDRIKADDKFLYALQVNADFNQFLIRINMKPTEYEIKELIKAIEIETGIN